MLDIKQVEHSLTIALQTRYKAYNSIKNHIASNFTTLNINRVESTRELSRLLDINKSTVGRVLLQLEDDNFISKVRCGSHPKHNYYVVRVSKQECFLYRNYYSLSLFKKKKFIRNLTTCGAKSTYEIIKNRFGRGIDFYEYDKATG